jgi:hypothetical protein
MTALVDRPRDGARLIGRTLWPERWWLTARYGPPGEPRAPPVGSRSAGRSVTHDETIGAVSMPRDERAFATPAVLCRDLGDESVLLDLATETYFGLNAQPARDCGGS